MASDKRATKYNFKLVEQDKFAFWNQNHFFQTHNRKPDLHYSILLPPPNVTGDPHLGHAMDAMYPAVLWRYYHFWGYQVVWIPGTDHAGIATQSKVEKALYQTEQKTRFDLGHKAFLARIYEFSQTTQKHVIANWQRWGLPLAYDKNHFTFNSEAKTLVNDVFIKLYQAGLIYQADQVVAWDVLLKTAISNIEVRYQQEKNQLYYFRYFDTNDPNSYLTVATTRPETMFVDQALFVHPKDKRYQAWIHKTVFNPVNHAVLPVLADRYVDPTFGSGVMKCTPAHDFNDFKLGLKYQLAMPLCMNQDGTLNELAGEFAKQDRLQAREAICSKLKEAMLLEKVETITNSVGYSERSQALIEPLLSKQWFLKMKPFAQKILSLQKSKQAVIFQPALFNERLKQWMEAIEDWCISRQLWWGHRLPVFENQKTKALKIALPGTLDETWVQSYDVLDTWFSSALWPLLCVDWKKGQKLQPQLYPFSVLVTGSDLLFFWVSRMMAYSLFLVDDIPFHKVIMHGLLRDKLNRKMSKSLNNGVLPETVINQFGCDSLSLFVTTTVTTGHDLRYEPEKLKQNTYFINKLWNASLFLLQFKEQWINIKAAQTMSYEEVCKLATSGASLALLQAFEKASHTFHKHIKNYHFKLAFKALYQFIWHKFCDWFIEITKFDATNNFLVILFFVFKASLVMLHVFIPFVTEEIYQKLFFKASILLESFVDLPKTNHTESYWPWVKDIVLKIRTLKTKYLIPSHHQLTGIITNLKPSSQQIIGQEQTLFLSYVKHFCKADLVFEVNPPEKNQYLVEVFAWGELWLQKKGLLNLELLIQQTKKQITVLTAEVQRSEKILANKHFLTKANPAKIEQEKIKYQGYLKALATASITLKDLAAENIQKIIK